MKTIPQQVFEKLSPLDGWYDDIKTMSRKHYIEGTLIWMLPKSESFNAENISSYYDPHFALWGTHPPLP